MEMCMYKSLISYPRKNFSTAKPWVSIGCRCGGTGYQNVSTDFGTCSVY